MSDQFEQKIIVLCDFSSNMMEVIAHGVKIAGIFNKELCLLSLWRNRKEKESVYSQHQELQAKISEGLSKINLSTLIVPHTLSDQIYRLVKYHNAVLLILHKSHASKTLKAFRQSRIPFLFVSNDKTDYMQYKNVLIPLDFRKASKETSLWASYFGRFNQSTVHIVTAHEKSMESTEGIIRNRIFFEKFLRSLNVRHQLIKGLTSSWGISSETIKRANEWKGDLLIVSGSSVISLIDLLIGLPELKILKKSGDLPVLLINPKKDSCVLCD